MRSQLLRVGVVAGLVVLSAVAQGREATDRLQIIVLVNNRAGVDQATILAAEKTAAKTYEQAGMDIDWRNCPSQAEPEVDRCGKTTEAGELFLNIEHQTGMLTPDGYGVAFIGDDGRGTHCDVFYDRILEMHRRFPRAEEATILGILMAHELGHLLLGPNAHSATGIMQPQWHYEDFLPTTFGVITFSRQQVQKITARRKQWTLMEQASR